MAAFRVSSGGLDKNVWHDTHESAAIEALTQWVICTDCVLGKVIFVKDSDDYERFFETETLLVGMGVGYRMIGEFKIMPRLFDFKSVIC